VLGSEPAGGTRLIQHFCNEVPKIDEIDQYNSYEYQGCGHCDDQLDPALLHGVTPTEISADSDCHEGSESQIRACG
jgi:hypothetical protein